MRRDLRFAAAVLATAVLLSSCSHSGSIAKAETPRAQDNFGVQMAKMNLWREAMFRFQRATEISPGDAMAHNNLAVAYEANGDFEKARREYLEALKLDKGNQYIQKNYSRFVEFTSRNKKRTPKSTTSTAASTSSTTSATPAAAPAAPSPAAPPMPSADQPAPPSQPAPASQPAPPPPVTSTSPNPPVPPNGGH